MSVDTGPWSTVPGESDETREQARSTARSVTARRLALVSALTLIGSFVGALYSLVDVVGNPELFIVLVAVSLGMATGLSRVLPERIAFLVGVGLFVFGFWIYISSLDVDVFATQRRLVDDVFSLLTGLSVLRLQRIELWVLGVTPAPVFLAWYLVLRARYVATALVGGGTLAFFILTGDVQTIVALFGVLGVAGTIGFGRLERFGGGNNGTEVLAIVLAAMVVLTMTVSVVPGGIGQPIQLLGGSGDQTVETSLISADQRLTVLGSVELSPEVRFTVESDQEAYWRVAAYDRYTGQGWVRTGGDQAYPGQLPGPPGRTETITQRYVIESRLNTMPAAWRPTSVSDTENARVTDIGGLQPAEPFTPGDTYTVRSQRPVTDRSQLQQAGRDYPDQIESEYTQLPASTPDRVAERTDRLTADADTPYETAQQIERWLENNREYSLDVDRPDGNIADAFLFEMDQGYCTYYATTMVTMLRSQGIPARFVVGYTPGEQTGSSEYVVRGLDSHAWVEVYVPDVGWVQFDPTPADPRADAEQERLEAAGVNDDSDVDRAGGDEDTETETTTTEPTTQTPANGTTFDPRNGSQIRRPGQPGSGESSTDTATSTATSDDADGSVPLPEPPSREQVLLGLVVLAGLAAGVRQTGAAQRAYRAVWLRWQPRSDPTADVERAFERVEYVLARTARPREPGETPREYLTAISADERVERVYDYYERVRYAGETSRELADSAVELANDVVSDRIGPL